MPEQDTVDDGIIICAGPGGLQAAIYLGRYNRVVIAAGDGAVAAIDIKSRLLNRL